MSTAVTAAMTAMILRAARASGLRLSLSAAVVGTPAGLGGPPPRVVRFAEGLDADLYLPELRGPGPRTAVVVIHGGAWRWGDKGENLRWNRWLAEHGYVVFDIQYRLAPLAAWPQMVADVRCAASWLQQHAGANPERIVLLGRSAGGHVALLAAYATDLAPWRVVALYPPTDLARLHATARGDLREGLHALLGGDPSSDGETYRVASPVQHVHRRAPRTLLIHGSADEVVPVEQSYLLGRRLQQAGVEVQTVAVPFARHAFDLAFDGLGTQLARAAVLAFLDEPTQPTLNQC